MEGSRGPKLEKHGFLITKCVCVHMNISILLVLKITRNTKVAKRGFSLLLKFGSPL